MSWNITYLFFEEWPRKFEPLLPVVDDHKMFGGGAVFACHFLNGFNVFDPTTEIFVKLWMEGRRGDLELGLRSLEGGFFELRVEVTVRLQEETIG